MKRFALILIVVTGCRFDDVAKTGIESASERVTVSIDRAANKFDPLLVELTRFVRAGATWMERVAYLPPGVTTPAFPQGTGVSTTAPVPTWDVLAISGLGAIGAVFTFGKSAYRRWLAYKANGGKQAGGG